MIIQIGLSDNLEASIFEFFEFRSVKINENILRSETAVISAISIVNYSIF